jgi:hypothetical protein
VLNRGAPYLQCVGVGIVVDAEVNPQIRSP